jgi:3-phenylpropionate/trans-cinnamate dioxygenase ferredoxin reductase subunit
MHRVSRIADFPMLAPVSTPESVLIVGAGLAGWRTAKELRKLGFVGPLTLIGDEDSLPYDRPPLSKQVLTGERPIEAVFLTTEEEVAELDIDLRRGVRVTSVAPGVIETESGERLEADAIVIATGSRANLPSFVSDMPDVRPLRNFRDAERIEADFGRVSSVLILGGGFIGAEVAGSARKRGLDVTIVEAMPSLLGPLGPEVGEVIRRIHEDAGVTVITEAPVDIVDATPEDGARVVLADGRKISADIVVVGFGARLNTEALGDLATPDGVLCDEHGRVIGHPGLYAAGDIAAWWEPKSQRHVRREHWAAAGDEASIVAHTIMDADASRLLAIPPYFWTDQPGVKVQLVGWPELADRQGWIEEEGIDPEVAYGWWRGDTLVAVAMLGSPRLLIRFRKELSELPPVVA